MAAFDFEIRLTSLVQGNNVLPLIAGAFTAASVAITILYQIYTLLLRGTPSGSSNGSVSWPPSPPAVPILGHLYLFSRNVHRDLYALSLKYGELFHVRLGYTHYLVASSANMAKLFLKTHDKSFASRPMGVASADIFSHNYQNIGAAPYGPHWRHMRKLCLMELFTAKQVEAFADIRNQEICSLVKCIREDSASGEPIKLNVRVSQFALNVISLMIMSKRLVCWGEQQDDDEELKEFLRNLKEFFKLSGPISNPGDIFPSLKWMDLLGFERRMKKAAKEFDVFILKLIRERRALNTADDSRENRADLLDILLSLPNETDGKLSDDMVLGTMLDMFLAGVDSATTIVEWAMAEVMRKPEVLTKLQEELDRCVGKERRVEESDLPHLQYLGAVIKETLRLRPPAPLLIPHESVEPCQVLGHDIPAKTRLFVNVWAIGRDPAEWEAPMEFQPERFLEGSRHADVDVKGQNYSLLPFGSGRRMCPGLPLGYVIVKIAMARLLHSFDFGLPAGQRPEDVDMSESLGLSMTKTHALCLTAVPRLPSHLYD